MTKPAYLGIDQGSSSTKGCLLDLEGYILKEFVVPVKAIVKAGEELVQDPVELAESVRNVLSQARSFAGESDFRIEGLGLAFQRSGVTAWDVRGNPLHGLISWSDTSTTAEISRLKDPAEITSLSSLPVTAHYAGGKIQRLQHRFPHAFVGTLDSFVMRRLSNDPESFVTEDTMAARTMLYAIEDAEWNDRLCAQFLVDKTRLATIRPSVHPHGDIDGVPVHAMLGDQQAALFGRMTPDGDPLLNLGTIASLLVPLGTSIETVPGFITSVLASRLYDDGKARVFILEGVTNSCGALVSTLTDDLKIVKSFQELVHLCDPTIFPEEPRYATVFLPKGGTATPTWRYDTGAFIEGWDGQNRVSLVRGVLEHLGSSIVSQIKILEARGLIRKESPLQVTGGLSALETLLQYIADASEFTLTVVGMREATARGAALAAMQGLGIIDDPADRNVLDPQRTFTPSGHLARERYDEWCALRDAALAGSVASAKPFPESLA